MSLESHFAQKKETLAETHHILRDIMDVDSDGGEVEEDVRSIKGQEIVIKI